MATAGKQFDVHAPHNRQANSGSSSSLSHSIRPLDQGTQQRDPAPGHAGFVSGGAKNGAGHLAESATIAAGNLVVLLFDSHLLPLARQAIRGENVVRVQGDALTRCINGQSSRGSPKTSWRRAKSTGAFSNKSVALTLSGKLAPVGPSLVAQL